MCTVALRLVLPVDLRAISHTGSILQGMGRGSILTRVSQRYPLELPWSSWYYPVMPWFAFPGWKLQFRFLDFIRANPVLATTRNF